MASLSLGALTVLVLVNEQKSRVSIYAKWPIWPKFFAKCFIYNCNRLRADLQQLCNDTCNSFINLVKILFLKCSVCVRTIQTKVNDILCEGIVQTLFFMSWYFVSFPPPPILAIIKVSQDCILRTMCVRTIIINTTSNRKFLFHN